MTIPEGFKVPLETPILHAERGRFRLNSAAYHHLLNGHEQLKVGAAEKDGRFALFVDEGRGGKVVNPNTYAFSSTRLGHILGRPPKTTFELEREGDHLTATFTPNPLPKPMERPEPQPKPEPKAEHLEHVEHVEPDHQEEEDDEDDEDEDVEDDDLWDDE